MAKRDIDGSWRDFQLRDVHLAFALLTRLPLPQLVFADTDARPAAHGAWAYPLVGLAVGAIVLAMVWMLDSLGALPAVAGGIAILVGVLVTGAMHEDGLADCADGFWGGWTPERRLEIMKDSQIGAYGVLALLLVVGIKWALLTQLIGNGAVVGAVLTAAVMSRGVMVWVMGTLPSARDTGLAKQTGQPGRHAVWAALGISVCVSALSIGTQVVFVGALAGVSGLALMQLARTKIGGQTGDVLGGTQQVIEVIVLLGITLAL